MAKENPWKQKISTAASKPSSKPAKTGRRSKRGGDKSRPSTTTKSNPERILVTNQPAGGSGRPPLAALALKKKLREVSTRFPPGSAVWAEWVSDPAYSTRPGERRTFSGDVISYDDKGWVTIIGSGVRLWMPITMLTLGERVER